MEKVVMEWVNGAEGMRGREQKDEVTEEDMMEG